MNVPLTEARDAVLKGQLFINRFIIKCATAVDGAIVRHAPQEIRNHPIRISAVVVGAADNDRCLSLHRQSLADPEAAGDSPAPCGIDKKEGLIFRRHERFFCCMRAAAGSTGQKNR